MRDYGAGGSGSDVMYGRGRQDGIAIAIFIVTLLQGGVSIARIRGLQLTGFLNGAMDWRTEGSVLAVS